MLTSVLPKTEFLNLERQTWLFTGAESPLHRGVKAAVNDYLNHRCSGPHGREYNAQIEASCRLNFSQLLSVRSGDIALLSNASEAIAAVLAAVQLKAGDNIVLHTLEYPSAVLGSLALRELGIEIRLVSHQDWQITPDALLAQVNERTRLVITSHVSYLSGTRINYPALYEKLKSTDTLLLLDATQSLGVVPVDARYADFVVSSSYKWLLGIHGAGVMAVNPARTGSLIPQSAGWRSVPDVFSPHRFETVERYSDARRFELGFPAFATLAALNTSTRILLECGIERIEQHVTALGSQLMTGLRELELQVMTPLEPKHRAGNIAFDFPNGERLAQQLLEQNILVWGGDGRVRLSMHGFNDESDIETALNGIQQAVQV